MLNNATISASKEIVQVLLKVYRNAQGVHSETVVGAAAALTGEFALRATEPILPKADRVASDRTKALIYQAEFIGKGTLWSVIKRFALNAGAKEVDLPDARVTDARISHAVGVSPFPPLSIPKEHFPHEWSPNAGPRLRATIEKIGAENALNTADLATALALAVGTLILETKHILPPIVSATLALEIMLGVACMAPFAVPREEPGKMTDARKVAGTVAPALKEFDQVVMRAGDEIKDIIFQTYWNEGHRHPGTMIGTLAALTGEFALRASESLPQGPGWVYSESATQFLFAGRDKGQITLDAIIEKCAMQAGAAKTDLPAAINVHLRATKAIGGSTGMSVPFPPISAPAEHQPKEWPPNACPRFRTAVREIGSKHSLSDRRLAMALAFAVGRLIIQIKPIVAPAISATLALEVMLGVARMAPLDVPIKPPIDNAI